MVQFSLVDPTQGREAYQWHRGFAASNDHLFPRTWKTYEALAENGQIWCARDGEDYLGLAYFHLQGDECEVGGLMVATSQRSKGIGSTLACLTLGHVLFEEDPLSRGVRIVAHVHSENNPGPRPIFRHLLKFSLARQVNIPGRELPGLKTNAEGFVVGDEFHLTKPDTLKALADWCRKWSGGTKDGRRAEIELGPETSLDTWAQAFDDMTSR